MVDTANAPMTQMVFWKFKEDLIFLFSANMLNSLCRSVNFYEWGYTYAHISPECLIVQLLCFL